MVYTKMIGNWTVLQWIVWIVLTVASVVVTYMWVNRRRKSITEEGAKGKVGKALKKNAQGTDTVLFNDVNLNLGAGKIVAVDSLMVGSFGMLLVKTFNRGVVVYGEPRKENWRIIERGYDQEVPNPLLTLENDIELLRNNFAKNSIYKVPMQPLAVFAETAMVPQLNLGSTKDAIIFKEIPTYLKGKFFTRENAVDVKALADYIGSLVTEEAATVLYTVKMATTTEPNVDAPAEAEPKALPTEVTPEVQAEPTQDAEVVTQTELLPESDSAAPEVEVEIVQDESTDEKIQ